MTTPLHVTLFIWCLLDLLVNSFILANLVLCQRLINEDFFQDQASLFPPHLVVRMTGFVALIVVILGDIFNLFAIFSRNLTLIVFWQLSFMLYNILAYATIFASFVTTLLTMMQWKVPYRGFIMSMSTNLHFCLGIYIFYFCVKRTVWTDAFKIILKSEIPKLAPAPPPGANGHQAQRGSQDMNV